MKRGDVVQLRSGGPRMVIREIGDDLGSHDKIYCNWFNLDLGKCHEATFYEEQLELFTERNKLEIKNEDAQGKMIWLGEK